MRLKSARFKAVLNCLSPEDGCQCTLEMLSTDHNDYLRDALCQKLAADISHGGWLLCHDTLTQQLRAAFDDLHDKGEGQEREYGLVLGKLTGLAATPQAFKSDIIPRLLASTSGNVRSAAYEALGAGLGAVPEVSVEAFVSDI